MIVKGKSYQSIWLDENDDSTVRYINQLLLPFEFRVDMLRSSGDVVDAIKEMRVRGAPLIGVTAAYGVALQMAADPSDAALAHAVDAAPRLRISSGLPNETA